MPPLARCQIAALADLADQLRYASRPALLRQIESAERLDHIALEGVLTQYVREADDGVPRGARAVIRGRAHELARLHRVQRGLRLGSVVPCLRTPSGIQGHDQRAFRSRALVQGRDEPADQEHERQGRQADRQRAAPA